MTSGIWIKRDYRLIGLLILQLVHKVESCVCDEDHIRSEAGNRTYIRDVKRAGLSHRILCCQIYVIAVEEPNSTIKWKFNGISLNESNSNFKPVKDCEGQVISTESLSLQDQGNYTCTINRLENGHHEFTTFLEVQPKRILRQGPLNVNVHGVKANRLGDPVNLNCTGTVGTNNYGAVSWFRLLPDRPRIFASDYGVKTKTVQVNERIWSQFSIESFAEEHVGDWECEVRNEYIPNVRFNFTLHVDAESKLHRTLFVIPVVFLALSFLAFFLWRFRWDLGLYVRRNARYLHLHQVTDADASHDVFIVHGSTASEWVMRTLLLELEQERGFSCYVPDRDMVGGDQITEAISREMSKSLRILLVLTPCLLDNKWDTWAVLQGMHAGVSSPSHIVAIILQELDEDKVASESPGFMRMLQRIKKVEVPKDIGMKSDSSDSRMSTMTVLQLMMRCLAFLVGDPVVQFWKKLIYCLELPRPAVGQLGLHTVQI